MRIVITGNGDEWDDADHCLHDAMLAAGADAEVYDQEPDGNCYTYLTLPDADFSPVLRELVEEAPHADCSLERSGRM